MKQTVYSDKPVNEGMKNALLRAQQLAFLRWTPIKPFPAIHSTGIAGVNPYPVFLGAYRPLVGANYAAVGYTNEKYVGVNVSIETFMTAVANPNSVLYTTTQHGKGRLTAAFYGTVCSEFASFVLGFPFHIDCPQFSVMEEMEHIDGSCLENLQLCDLLNEPKSHTAIVTGIDRDENGKVVNITVTESTPPQVRITHFLPREFVGCWLEKGYEVLRYKDLHKVTYTPNPWVHLEGDPELPVPVPNPVILPDYGDKANYRLGESVTFSVFDAAYTQIKVRQGDKTVATLALSENADATFSPAAPGYYTAVAVSPAGESLPVEFCVTEAAVVTDRAEYQPGEAVRVSFSCTLDDELAGWMVKKSTHAKFLGIMRSEDGTLSDSAVLPAGEYYIIAHYRNRYGVYSATPTPIFRVIGE